jgi:hypothetical protein
MPRQYTVTAETVFGTIVKVFDTLSDALAFIQICMENDVECIVN